MLKKAAALFLLCGSIAMWIACGSTSNRFVYAAISQAQQVAAYREDPNSGTLTALRNSPFTTGQGPRSIAVHPSKKFLYVSNSAESTISLFTVGTDGALTEVTPRTNGGLTPVLLQMDPAGAFLYAANAGSNSLSVFAVDGGSGGLTEAPGSPYPIGIAPISMTLSSGGFLYIGGSGSPGLIEVFSTSGVANGALTPVTGSPFLTGANPYGLTFDPSGTHLYTANLNDNSISEFNIGADGSLVQLAGSPIGETFLNPSSIALDPSGKYLYVTNQGSGNVAAYSVDTDGSLTILSTSSFTTASSPSIIVADPGGKYLLVGNQTSPVIQVFLINSGDGTLTSVASYSVGGTPTSIVLTH